MPEHEATGGGSVLATRLDALFRTSRPGNRRWTNDEVTEAIKKTNPGLKVSGAYLSALRNGAERGRAAGWSGLELRAFVESEQLKAALDARRSGRKPDVPHPAPCPHLSENFASELDWLTRIAEAFGRPE